MTLDKIMHHLVRIDVAMLAAAVVEVPRWAVAFAAIREPMYAAIPMGLLLAWAASAGWRAYFANRRRYLLLCINVASLLGALIVIAPVLYAMTYMPLQQVDLSKVLQPQWLATWAAVLAVTTFIPLVQIAAVKAYARDDAEPTPVPQHDAKTAPDATQHRNHAESPVAQPAPVLDAKARALQLASEGLTATQIATEVGVNPNTVRSWLRRAATKVVQA